MKNPFKTLTYLQALILYGIFRLVFGPQETYNPNDIIWQFLPGKSLKVIVNTTTIPTNSQMPYTTSTTATYTLTENNKVTIKEVVYDISFIDGKLILNADASADGKLISLTKIEI